MKMHEAHKEKLVSSPAASPKQTGAVQCKGREARTTYPGAPVQLKPNSTGLPDKLKAGIESLSGFTMDDVRVHYHSPKPAALNALAYAQGTDIHIGAGQEKHLPHEAWHVVQQKQGRVRATMQLKEKVELNDDERLEREADVMGRQAFMTDLVTITPPVTQDNDRLLANRPASPVIQRVINKKDLKESLKRSSKYSEMGSYLKTSVKVKDAKKYWRTKKLGAVGMAVIEYIFESQDDGDIDATDKAKLDAAVFWIDKSDKSCSSKADIITEVEAVMETLASKARASEGGGLLHKTGEKQWAYQKPFPPTPERIATQEEWSALGFWQPPVDQPSRGATTPDVLHTPGGSKMHRVSSYRYESNGVPRATHTYAKGVPGREPDFTPNVPATAPTKLGIYPGSSKKVGPVKIDLILLNKWAGTRAGWKPDQNTAMKKTSAKEAAAASGYPITSEWQWLHLIAFTLGGGDGKQPNKEENLVAGLASANGFHLVLENLVKKMILSGYTNQIEIIATADMIPGSYHVAKNISYLLKWTDPSNKIIIDDFAINTLDPNKAMGGHLSVLYKQFTAENSAAIKATTKDYTDAIAMMKKGVPVTNTSKAALAAVESYKEGITALQSGGAVRNSVAALAAESDYNDAVTALQKGKKAGVSDAAKAAEKNYSDAIDALQSGNNAGTSIAAKAAEADYNEAVTLLQAGDTINDDIMAQAAAEIDYKNAVTGLTNGHAVGPSMAAKAAYDAYFQEIIAIQTGDALGSSEAATAARTDYKDAIDAKRTGKTVGVSLAATAANDNYQQGLDDAENELANAEPNNPGYLEGFNRGKKNLRNASYKSDGTSPSKKLKVSSSNE